MEVMWSTATVEGAAAKVLVDAAPDSGPAPEALTPRTTMLDTAFGPRPDRVTEFPAGEARSWEVCEARKTS